VHRRFDRVGKLMALLRDDRERAHFVVERACQVVDLGRRGVPSGEHAEVDANLECRVLVFANAEGDDGIHGGAGDSS